MIRQVIIRGTQVRFGNSVLGSKMLGGGRGGSGGGLGGPLKSFSRCMIRNLVSPC